MATTTYTILTCDMCAAEHADDSPVRTHTLTLDSRRPREVDACGSCWSAVEQLAAAGRRSRQS